MTRDSTARARFARYLRAARRREGARRTLVCLAAVVLALTLLTAFGTFAAEQRGMTFALAASVRALFVLLTLALVVTLAWRPLGRLRADRGASLVESADAAFDGRVRTYLDTEERAPDHPFLPLLARDGLSVARRVPLGRIVPGSAIALPLILLLVILAGVATFVLEAPSGWRNTALHFWWGWRDPTLVEPRVVEVSPGSVELLAGENLDIDVTLSGFARESVTLHARSGDGEWQSTEIARAEDDAFHFSVFRVEEPLEYYVSAAWTESERFRVDVVEPARLERIDATYEYPEWTALEPRRVEDAGALAAVKNTRVALAFTTDRPLVDGRLALGDARLPLERDGLVYRAELVVREDTEYRLVDRLLGREVAISPTHPITVRGDQPPEVRFALPGRDISASPIEEVTLAVEARDDFGIESMELLYSVNAGEWRSVALPIDAGGGAVEHVFSLETMGGSAERDALLDADAAGGGARGGEGEWREVERAPIDGRGDGSADAGVEGADGDSLEIEKDPADGGADAATDEDGATAGIEGGEAMTPGDLITYYVRVRDHDSVSETDMMLIDVRPFERRFSEGQGGGGGGGGGGGAANEGSEISQRQKEILLATWNLQRSVEAADGDTAGHEDNARLLSRLQSTLAEQARTLADRSEARELVEQGEEIRRFVDYLREAAEAMGPSSAALDELDFDAAIRPQQRALQLLQRAEALFADIRLTRQEPGQGGGGGQQPGQDMAEMFELEMDLERNQYERPDRGGGGEARPERLDDIFEDLAELARRQQELAEAARREGPPTREERWRQQRLERELEELQRDLEALEEQAREAEGAEGEALREAAREAAERLEQARRALEGERADESGEETRRAEADETDGSDASEPGEPGERTADAGAERVPDTSAAEAASRALREALRGLGEERSRDLERGLAEAVAAAEAILDEQRSVERELREAVQRAARANDAGLLRPLGREEAAALAERKRELRRATERVRGDVVELDRRFGEQAPATGEILAEAIERLDESRVADMLGIAGDAIDSGAVATVLPGESVVTNALREWRDRLSEALDAAASESLQVRDDSDPRLSDALERIQELRRRLDPEGAGGWQSAALDDGDGRSGENGADASAESGGASDDENDGGRNADRDGDGRTGEEESRDGRERDDEAGRDAASEGAREDGRQREGEQGDGRRGEGRQGEGQQGDGQRGEGQQGEGQQGEGQQGEGQRGEGQQGEGQQGEGRQGAGGQRGDGRGEGGRGESGNDVRVGEAARAGGDAASAGVGGLSQGRGAIGEGRPRGGEQRGYTDERDRAETAGALDSLVTDLDAIGVDPETLEALRSSVDLIRSGDGSINAARVEAEYRRILRQIEQIELELTDNTAVDPFGGESGPTRRRVSESAADYYRRLSERPERLTR